MLNGSKSHSVGQQSAMAAIQHFGSVYYPLLVLGGAVGNILTIVAMYSNRAMRNTRGKFILLAAADTAVLLFNPPRYFFMFTLGYDLRTWSSAVCKAHSFLAYWSRDVATWILVLISFERLIATAFPYQIGKFQKSRTALVLWCLVMLLLLAKDASLLHFIARIDLPNNRTSCDTDQLTYRKVFMGLDSLVYCALPSVCLFVCNGGILYYLQRSRKMFRTPSTVATCGSNQSAHAQQISSSKKKKKRWLRLRPHRSQVSKARNSSSSSSSQSMATAMLIPVSAFHLVTTMPFAVTSVVEAAMNIRHGQDAQSAEYIQAVVACLLMLAYLNNGLGCLVYLVGSRRFRRHCVALCFGIRPTASSAVQCSEVSRLQASSVYRQSSVRSLSSNVQLAVAEAKLVLLQPNELLDYAKKPKAPEFV